MFGLVAIGVAGPAIHQEMDPAVKLGNCVGQLETQLRKIFCEIGCNTIDRNR